MKRKIYDRLLKWKREESSATAFLIDGVKRGYETVEKIYEKAGAKDNCRLVVTEKGHFWCEDIVWKTINQEIKNTHK